MRGRPRKSLKELDLSGSLDHDKKRYAGRVNPPKPEGKIGSAPRHLDQEQRLVWKELVRLVPSGLLGKSDRPPMEILTVLTATFRKHGTGGKFGVTSKDLSLMVQLQNNFGMSPTGRSRLNLPRDDRPKNPIEQFLKRRRTAATSAERQGDYGPN